MTSAPLGNYERLKPLEPLIGAWAGEFVSPHDWPTAHIKQGQKLLHTLTFQWDLDRSVILQRWTIGAPGADPFWQSTWLIGWDTAGRRIVCFAFESTGGHQVIDDWTIEGDIVTAKGRGADPFGRQTTFTMVISEMKADSFVREMIDVVMDGKRQPDFDKVLMKRTPS